MGCEQCFILILRQYSEVLWMWCFTSIFTVLTCNLLMLFSAAVTVFTMSVCLSWSSLCKHTHTILCWKKNLFPCYFTHMWPWTTKPAISVNFSRYNYLKIWNLRVQKIAFKVVQMKFLAMHINQKLSFNIFTVGNLQNIFMEHDLYLIS